MDSYIDGLSKLLKSLNIGAPSKPATFKRKLIELLDESESESLTDDDQVAECSRRKKQLCSDSDLEDAFSSVLRRASISDTNKVVEPFEAEKTSSKVKTKNKKKYQKGNRQMALDLLIYFLFFKKLCSNILN